LGISAFKSGIFGIYFPYVTTTASTAIIIASIISDKRSWLTRLLSIRLLVYLGSISYSLYMTNLLTIKIVQATTPLSENDIWFRLLAALLCCLISGLLFKYFESPARKFLYSYQR
jgi:peptidoglycan/LPS O-acetylase OafA/YrhL